MVCFGPTQRVAVASASSRANALSDGDRWLDRLS